MTQIAATDSALVRLLEGCDFPGVDVASGPHEWDGAYVTRLLSAAPALRVVFRGAEPYSDTKSSTVLNMEGQWAVYVVTGWHGAGQEARRLGAGAGYDLLHRAASVLHSAILREENGARLPIASVNGIDVLTDSALDLGNLWVGAISVAVELPLELLESESCYGPLDDFIRVRGTFDLPGGLPAPDIADVGTEGDVPFRVDLEQ